MIRMKYIVHKSIRAGEEKLPETIIMFPEHQMHSGFKGCFRIISAGFVSIKFAISEDGHIRAEAYCHGHSESLHLSARPEDSLLANIALRNQI